MIADTDCCVDEHHQDQLLVYMALASGRSQIQTTKELELHTTTMLTLLGMFCDAKIELQKSERGNTIIIIEGISVKYN